MQEAADLIAALAAVTSVRTRALTASDAELVADTALIEQIGRIVDAWRIEAAGQLEHRSRKGLGELSLAFTSGARDGVELVQIITRVSYPEAKRRVGLGGALAPAMVLGQVLPGRLPEVTDAVAAGLIGVDSARVIANLVKRVHRRAKPEDLAAAVRALIRTAQETDAEGVREAAGWWDLALDPDGDGPGDRQQRAKRALRIGATRLDGTTQVTARMLPEHLALLKELLQSRRRTTPLLRTEAGSDETDDSLGPAWRPDEPCGDPEFHEPRSRQQQDYDTLMEALALAVRAEAEGIDGTAVTHTTVVTVTAAEVEARQGRGWAPGILAGLPMPVIERRACTDALRLQVIGPKGEAMHLTREHRTFSAAQKLALTVGAGGRCQYPGCRVPHPYLEAHHVKWFARDHGETVIENGIMLCSYHHHLVHAKESPIEIREHLGEHYIVPTGWRGDPDPAHRQQTGPPVDPRFRRPRFAPPAAA